MRLRKLTVENFRGYQHRTEINIDGFTAVIGRNDVGKSTILEALEIFFNSEIVQLDAQDVNVRGRGAPIRIGCAFDQYPALLTLDDTSETTLAAEGLLNPDGLLEIVKAWDCSGSGKPKPTVFANALHPTADGAADLLKLKNGDLKKQAKELGVNLKEVDERSNARLREAIRNHIGDLKSDLRLVPLNSDDGRKVWEQLERQMPAFALFQSDRPSKDDDPEVQDPMRLAVQQAVKSVEAELAAIKDRVQTHAVEVATRTLAKLREMDPTLAEQLQPVFKAEPKWDGFKLALTGDEDIPINKRGSGVRRLILLNFFRAEAERRRADSGSPGIIYAVEEPENSQHPNNQTMLVRALLELSRKPNTQVLVTTHVPGIASLLPQDGIRFVFRTPDGHPFVGTGSEAMLQRVASELGVVPDSRVQVLVYVEGPNDVSFLGHMCRLLRTEHPDLVDLENDPRVAFVVTGGGNLQHWVNQQYLARLNKAEVHIFDRDDAEPPKYQRAVDKVNARGDGSYACLTSKREMENYLHPDAIAGALGLGVEFTAACDVPEIVAAAYHETTRSPRKWDELDKDDKREKISRIKRLLNNEVAARMTIADLRASDPDEEILGWFREITQRANAAEPTAEGGFALAG